MRKLFIVSIELVILLSSCTSSKVLSSELVLKNYKYYKKQSEKLFTGIAITKFDNGVISSSTEIKNGVPDGNWFDYGYKGEVIHDGKFLPVQLQESLITKRNIERLNISFFKEGDYSFIYVYVLGQKNFNEEVNDTIKFKKDIEQLLQQKNILGKTDSINKLKFVKGELE